MHGSKVLSAIVPNKESWQLRTALLSDGCYNESIKKNNLCCQSGKCMVHQRLQLDEDAVLLCT